MKRLASRALIRCALGFALALSVAIVVEYQIEMRERARLAEGATFVKVGPRRVHYRLVGEGLPGPTVVLVSGFAATVQQWSAEQNALADFVPTLTYDRGGMGLSDPLDGHDAIAQSDELSALLDTGAFKPPFVIVSFSASSMIARAFGARHVGQAQGFVFLDPVMPQQLGSILPEAAIHTTSVYLRAPAKILVQNVVGYTRLRRAITKQALLDVTLLSSHAWSVWQEGLAYADSARDSIPFPRTEGPIGVLSLWRDTPEPFFRESYRLHQELAALSSKGVFRDLPGRAHGGLVSDPANLAPILELIRAVVTRAREQPGQLAVPTPSVPDATR